jgi:hypothetical protein
MGTFEIRVAGLEELKKDWSDKAQNQIPYALKVAINACAERGMYRVINRIGNVFHDRGANRPPAAGVRMLYASKQNLTATVYDKDWYMHYQEEGGIKSPQSAKHLYIPTEAIRTATSPIEKRNKIGVLIEEMKSHGIAKAARSKGKKGVQYGLETPFFITLRSGLRGIAQREGAGRYPVRLLYLFKGSVSVKPVLHFRQTIAETVQADMQSEFSKSMSAAMSTAR